MKVIRIEGRERIRSTDVWRRSPNIPSKESVILAMSGQQNCGVHPGSDYYDDYIGENCAILLGKYFFRLVEDNFFPVVKAQEENMPRRKQFLFKKSEFSNPLPLP